LELSTSKEQFKWGSSLTFFMKIKSYFLYLSVLILNFTFIVPPSFSQNVPDFLPTDAGSEARAIQERRVPDIPKPREIPEIDEQLPEPKGVELPKKKVFINEILIEGNTVISDEKIKQITKGFEDRDIILNELNEVAKQITTLYRSEGYVTSQAYLPPQKILDGKVTINVLEAKVGEVKVEGNRWFKDYSIKRLIDLKSGEVFKAQKLEQSLIYLNRSNPDVAGKAVLAPSEIKEATDIIIQVKDKFPIHFGHQYDNLGTKFSGRNRQNLTLTNNNLLTLNDRLIARVIISERHNLVGVSGNYSLPLNSKGWVGNLSFSHVNLSLGKSLKPIEVLGRSTSFIPTISIPMFLTPNLEGTWSTGMDFARTRTRILAREDSNDVTRALSFGPTFTQYDRWGRTVMTNNFRIGFSNFLGSSDRRDDNASRDSTGGAFFDYSLGMTRFQKLFWDQVLILRGSMQVSPDRLISSEQFRIGGMDTVRGYAEGEYLGDKGFIGSAEIRIPPYFLPKRPITVFGQTMNMRDLIQFVGFFDMGRAWLQEPRAGETDNKILAGVGGGVLLNLFNHVSARVYFAQAIADDPNDADFFRLHFSLTSDF